MLLESVRTRRCARAVAAGVLAASASTAALAGSPGGHRQPLWAAANAGLVRVEGRSVDGYSLAELAITNVSPDAVTVDVNASYLEPVDPPHPVQPLGLGLPSEHRRLTDVEIQAGAKAKVSVLSVCMDHDVSSPDGQTKFRLARAEAPAPIARVLKAWRRHPDAHQESVQAAAWGNASDFAALQERTERVGLPERTRRVAVVDGRVFAVTERRELVAAYPRGEWRTVGRAVESISVTADRVWALARVSPLAPAVTADADWCVAGCDATTGEWGDVLEVRRGGELRWASPGAALVEQGGALCLHTRERVRRVGAAGDLVAPGPGEVAVLARDDRDPASATLTRFDVRDGRERETRLQAPDSLEAMALAGPLYGLAGGHVVALADGPARTLRVPGDLRPGEHTGEDWDRCVSLARLDGGLVVETNGPTYFRRRGSAAFAFRPQPAGTTLVSDAARDALYAWSGTELRAYEPETGHWTPVDFFRPLTPDPEDEPTLQTRNEPSPPALLASRLPAFPRR